MKLNNKEEKELTNYINDILNNRNPNVKVLKSNQLIKLAEFVVSLQNSLQFDPLENSIF